MKGFTFCDDSPFPSFVARGQPLFFVFGRAGIHRTETNARSLAHQLCEVSPSRYDDNRSSHSSAGVREHDLAGAMCEPAMSEKSNLSR
jgi:hypothetical protein